MMGDNLFEIQNTPDYALIRFSGFVDASTVAQARPVVQAQVPATCANFVVDLTGVDFLDSHGVGLFVSLLKRAHLNRGRVIIAGAEGQPSSVLQMVGFNGDLVAYCKNTEDAKAFLAQGKTA